MFFIPPSPVLDSVFDLFTISFITAILILSICSLCFIFHLRFKSKSLTHLQHFNSLWTVRFLLVSFISLWAVTELYRLPFFRRRYLYPFLSSLTISQQSNLCKIHVVLSLGFFEPAFLVTLLFLVNASIKHKNPNDIWAISFVLITCLPLLLLQIVLIFFMPFELQLPGFFRRSSIVWKDGFGNQTVLCAYPLLNTIAFGMFGIGYAVWFLFSCWKVVSMVINKGLRYRLYGLIFAVVVSLPVQILCLGLSVLWNPDEMANSVVALVAFLSTFSCASVGEGILVIKPVADALDVEGTCSRWTPGFGSGMKPVGGRTV
ncbi:Plasminogen activator inhibitor [Quillaja saponaria]|uniref:Plasminogen activator inhibitor n=1 Tax=Quillaja saponaria TaxID=32244 RepID=A0AAD7PSA8_QUISA|nr:Plasminogen activator inhibitor [Quillaja saponaria]